jgi:hypothetical protein
MFIASEIDGNTATVVADFDARLCVFRGRAIAKPEPCESGL